MPIFWRVLIIKGCWILSKTFYASIEIIMWFLYFSLSTIENNVCCRLIIYGLYYIEVGSFHAHFLKSFNHKNSSTLATSCKELDMTEQLNWTELNHKWVLDFVKGFFCIYLDYHMVFILQFVNVVYHIDWFANIEESLHPWDKAQLVMMYDLFNMLLDSVC